jgi:hypothetical protein
MTPTFDKAKIEAEMLASFTKLYGQFPEILAKIIENYKAGAHWNKNMSEAEIRQTVRLIDGSKNKGMDTKG